MADYWITIDHQFAGGTQVVFGLDVGARSSEFPLLVGCSLRRLNGQLVDVPARWLKSPGRALWPVAIPEGFQAGPAREDGWAGGIIFALWRDATFTERLTDTGWVSWKSPWLVGASTTSADYRDAQMELLYGARANVWTTVGVKSDCG